MESEVSVFLCEVYDKKIRGIFLVMVAEEIERMDRKNKK